MRYVQKEPILTTVTDKEVSEESEIREILAAIKQNNQDIGIQFSDADSDAVRTLDKVRIIDIHDNAVDLHAFFSNSSAKFKNVSFYSIKRIVIIASRQIMARKYKVSRWQLLDVADLGE